MNTLFAYAGWQRTGSSPPRLQQSARQRASAPDPARKTPLRGPHSSLFQPALNLNLQSTVSKRLRIQNHLAELLALFQTLMRGCGFTQREALIDNRLNLAVTDMLHHLVKVAHRAHERSKK